MPFDDPGNNFLSQFGVELTKRFKAHVAKVSDGIIRRLELLEARQPEKGEKGDPGEKGIDGKDGEKGSAGEPGVVTALVNKSGNLILTRYDGETIDLGCVIGPKGIDGKNGRDGKMGRDGKTGPIGPRGEKGNPGKDGKDGKPGLDGRNGIDGKDGEPGKDGEKGERGESGLSGLSVVNAFIEPAGNLVLRMNDGLEIVAGYVVGKDGEPGKDGEKGIDGKDGEPGKDGRDGVDGKDGEPGKDGEKGDPGRDGISINNAYIDDNCSLVIQLSDNSIFDVGLVIGPPGEKGDPGLNGRDGVDGKDGEPGRDGLDGKDVDTEVLQDILNINKYLQDEVSSLRDIINTRVYVDHVIDATGNLIGVNLKGETKNLGRVCGQDGRDGKDGEKGEKGDPGFKLENFNVELIKGKTLSFKFDDGEQIQAYEYDLPLPEYVGVYNIDTNYDSGDIVTYGGSLWGCTEPSKGVRPDKGQGWRLMVKKGRDGKDGVKGDKGDPGKDGKPGRDGGYS